MEKAQDDWETHEVLTCRRLQYKKKARGLLTASSDFTPPDLAEGKHTVNTEVVIKDRVLDTVAIAHLSWSVETKES